MLITELGLNPNSFSTKANIQPQTLHHIIGGRLTKPGFEIIEKILSTFVDVNPDWLIRGIGHVFRQKEGLIAAEPAALYSKNSVPLVSVEALAGNGNAAFTIEQKDIKGFYVVPDFTNIQFMMRVTGNSMYPKYNSGDVVACRILKEPSFIQWNKVHVIATKDQGILIKRLKKSSKDKYYTCISDNSDYDAFDIPIKEVSGVALVVGVIRLE